MNKERMLTVAAVQMRNNPKAGKENFLRAEELIREAAGGGARVVLLPEMFPKGYVASEAVWPLGEPDRGETTRWQCRLSTELGITLGAGFPLWQGDDLINVYQLSNSRGELWGRVQKVKTETDVFLPGSLGHVISTDTGTVGLGICADNHMASFLRRMTLESVDWMAMPHACPVPVRTGGPISQGDIQKAVDDLKRFPYLYSRTLGVPVVFVNGIGAMEPMSGTIGKLLDPRFFELGGHSAILDESGACLASLEREEGVISAKIFLGRKGTIHPFPEDYEGWLHRGNLFLRKVLMPIGQVTSRRRYRSQKKNRARFAPEV